MCPFYRESSGMRNVLEPGFQRLFQTAIAEVRAHMEDLGRQGWKTKSQSIKTFCMLSF